MIYQKRTVDGFGELEFLGNWGALAEFEEMIGMGYTDVFKEGQMPRISHIIQFVYACYVIAQKRQAKDVAITYEQFTAVADKWVIELYPVLLQDALQVNDAKPVQKKIVKATK